MNNTYIILLLIVIFTGQILKQFWQTVDLKEVFHLEKVVAMQPYKLCYYCELPNADTCPAGGILL